MKRSETKETTMRETLRMKFPALCARAAAGSRKAAIRLFCLECMGGNRAEVTRCASTTCALFPFRTSQSASKALFAITGVSKAGQTVQDGGGAR